MDTPEHSEDDPLIPPGQEWQPTAEMFATIQEVAIRHAKEMIDHAKEKGEPVPDDFDPEYLAFAINTTFQLSALGMVTDRMASALFMDWFTSLRIGWRRDAIRDAVTGALRDADDSTKVNVAEVMQAIGKDLGIDMEITEMVKGGKLAEF